MKTEQLIKYLSENLKPVKPVSPTKSLLWILPLYAACIVLFLSFRSDSFRKIVWPENYMDLLILSVSFLLTLVIALKLSVPGAAKKLLALALPLILVIWLASAVSRIDNTYANPYNYHSCITDILLLGLLFAALPGIAIKQYYSTNIGLNFSFLLAAGFLLSALTLEIICPDKSFYHLLKIHILPLVVLFLLLWPFRTLIKNK